MITEDFVSFEVAKLLKEKGFYQDFLSEMMPVWKLNGNRTELVFHGCDNYPCENDEWYSAPTLQTAMKWLREEHNIFIEISISIDPNYDYHFNYTILDKKCEYVRRGYVDPDWINWKYEEAVEAALKYTLENLI